MSLMYFSVITPVNLRQAAHEMAQSAAYAEHQWLWKFFPSSQDQQRDFIFRRYDQEVTPRFYIVSKRQPVAFSDIWQVQSQPYAPQLSDGLHLSFQLRANPVITKTNDKGKPQRHDVVMDAKKRFLLEHGLTEDATWRDLKQDEDKPLLYELTQQTCLDWLQSRSDRLGFSIVAANVDAYQQHRADKREIRFSTVDFSGELIVTDHELFQHTLFHGIGHAKAFGCGLLLVKKLKAD
ncbi:type I-E CRISPR-associated protein Cas6/Cse3/CasE [Undibacterium crateris]|uniref:type I-E CRISPR-associated protein Cas6/Cse3/CasE n=1 Tax=Undibacterium crateris TaxID=2528175 RepID=UPI00138950DC|nr:type I-E CRISPR-associated protein Cas6/Cse3/CasE [Undibacterium crateris]NDI84531.1 type I-E CRISPR-associated protein Cas6/Cse3/CasE [Undibacterium crateris]